MAIVDFWVKMEAIRSPEMSITADKTTPYQKPEEQR
jgi:hypothetical protein